MWTDILSKITKKKKKFRAKTNKQSLKKCSKFPRPPRRAAAGGGYAARRPLWGGPRGAAAAPAAPGAKWCEQPGRPRGGSRTPAARAPGANKAARPRPLPHRRRPAAPHAASPGPAALLLGRPPGPLARRYGVGEGERKKNPSLRKWRQLGERGEGKKKPRRLWPGVWNIESRRGCSAGLRPRVAPPSAFEKKGGWEPSAGRGRELPARLRTRETPARCGPRRRRPARLLPAAQSASSEASAGGGRARRRRALSLAACLAEGRGAAAAGGRAVPARPARSLRASLHPGGARVRPRAARTKSAAGTRRTGPAALGRGEGGGAGAVSRGRCAAGWLPAWARLRSEAAYWTTRLTGWSWGHARAGSTPLFQRTGQRSPGVPAWARAWVAWPVVPHCPGRLRLPEAPDEAKYWGRGAATRPSWELRGQDEVLDTEGRRKDFETRWPASVYLLALAFQRESSYGCFQNLKIQND